MMGGKASGTGGARADILSPILCIHLKHVLKWCIWATLEAGIYVTLLPPGKLHMKQVLGDPWFSVGPCQLALAVSPYSTGLLWA